MLRMREFLNNGNWQEMLDVETITRDKCNQVYVCSPLSAETKEERYKNLKIAREYCFLVNTYWDMYRAVAPHAYLPMLFNDESEEERSLALKLDTDLLLNSRAVFVCGNRLSEGMKAEVVLAAKNMIPVYYFSEAIMEEIKALTKRAEYIPGYSNLAARVPSEHLRRACAS